MSTKSTESTVYPDVQLTYAEWVAYIHKSLKK